MLRFDVPAVWSNVIRLEAFITFALSALALYTATPWLMLPLLAQGLVRGFIGHHRCPSHGLWKTLLQKLGKAGKKENAGAKMFANKLLFIASSVSLMLAAGGRRPVAVAGSGHRAGGVCYAGVGAVVLRRLLGLHPVVSRFPGTDLSRTSLLKISAHGWYFFIEKPA